MYPSKSELVAHDSGLPCLLALSFYYPPANNPRAVQVARLLRHLDLPTDLICADYDDKNDRRDELLAAEAEAFLRTIVRVPFCRPAFWRNASRLAVFLGRPFWDELPDDSRSWKSNAVASVAALFQNAEHSGCVLVTFGSPMSDHLIGLELKRRYRIPWMAHFSDPWVDNPFKKYNWLTRKANLAYERSVMEAADRLLFTSEETIDLVMAKYERSWRKKTRVVTHSYESSQYRIVPTRTDSEITIRFLGDMYGPRTPKPLFAALSSILLEDERTLKGVRFEFVGSMYNLDLGAMGLDRLPKGLVVLRDTVSNRESLNLMSSADGLLVIDAPAEMSVFLPSKLIDYIGAGKPILGITPPGTASRLIAELGGWTGDPADPIKVIDAVKSFVRFLQGQRGLGQPWGREAVRKQFEAASVAANFHRLVLELV